MYSGCSFHQAVKQSGAGVLVTQVMKLTVASMFPLILNRPPGESQRMKAEAYRVIPKGI